MPRSPRAIDPELQPQSTRSLTAHDVELGAERAFRAALAAGARVVADGQARDRPELIVRGHTRPRVRFEAFGHEFYLSKALRDDYIGFLVAYVARAGRPEGTVIHPRIFYRDLGLMWRCATHLVRTPDETWIGKGAVRSYREGDEIVEHSAEETTDLPFELQTALDHAASLQRPWRHARATELVLRNAPAGRMQPYADFTRPRERDMAQVRIHGGRPIARFRRSDDPESLTFAAGFEPDLDAGVVEVAEPRESRFYGGPVGRTRVLSSNRQVQYQFTHSPRHVWLAPPQARTARVSSYGVRTVDVIAPEELFIPGYEYHLRHEGELHSQIPAGFVGPQHPEDSNRADASPWNHALPPVRDFRARRRVRVNAPEAL